MDTIDENTIRAIRFERPDHIPMIFWINPACWHHDGREVLLELMGDHCMLFPEFKGEDEPEPELAPFERAAAPYTDGVGQDGRKWVGRWRTIPPGHSKNRTTADRCKIQATKYRCLRTGVA